MDESYGLHPQTSAFSTGHREKCAVVSLCESADCQDPLAPDTGDGPQRALGVLALTCTRRLLPHGGLHGLYHLLPPTRTHFDSRLHQRHSRLQEHEHHGSTGLDVSDVDFTTHTEKTRHGSGLV